MPEFHFAHLPAEMQKTIDEFEKKIANIVNSFARQINEKQSPSIIFHYTNDQGLRGIIETGKLWLTDIFYLNDPSELRHGCSPAIELIAEAPNDPRPEIKWLYEYLSEHLEKTLHSGIEQVSDFFTLSFSEAGNDLGQWRAYADNGRGYAIGFDARALEQAFANRKQGRMTFPVRYSENELRCMHKKILDLLFQLHSMPREKNLAARYAFRLLISLSRQIIHAALFFKHDAYSNEREYRFLESFQSREEVPKVNHRSRPYSLIRYREFDWRGVARHSLEKIVVGPAADAEKARRFAEDCLRAFHAGDVDISHSDIPYRAV